MIMEKGKVEMNRKCYKFFFANFYLSYSPQTDVKFIKFVVWWHLVLSSLAFKHILSQLYDPEYITSETSPPYSFYPKVDAAKLSTRSQNSGCTLENLFRVHRFLKSWPSPSCKSWCIYNVNRLHVCVACALFIEQCWLSVRQGGSTENTVILASQRWKWREVEKITFTPDKLFARVCEKGKKKMTPTASGGNRSKQRTLMCALIECWTRRRLWLGTRTLVQALSMAATLEHIEHVRAVCFSSRIFFLPHRRREKFQDRSGEQRTKEAKNRLAVDSRKVQPREFSIFFYGFRCNFVRNACTLYFYGFQLYFRLTISSGSA